MVFREDGSLDVESIEFIDKRDEEDERRIKADMPTQGAQKPVSAMFFASPLSYFYDHSCE